MQNQSFQKGFIYVGLIFGLFSIILQFILMLHSRDTSLAESIIRFFSFFTIISNSMAVLHFIGLLLTAQKKLHQFVQRNETASAVSMYIIVVGFVYQIILKPLLLAPLQGWFMIADNILHALIPFLILVYWILFLSSKKINVQTLPYCLIYPVVYLAYTLIRGSFIDFYPYPLVAVNKLGYGKVLLNSALLVLFFLGLAYLFATFANWRYKKNQPVKSLIA